MSQRTREDHTTREDAPQPRLVLAWDSRDCRLQVSRVEVAAAPESAAPFRVDAFAFEEDTFQVLSADCDVRETDESVAHLMIRAMNMRPEKPGTVLVRPGDPLRLLCIVHDLDRDPTWHEGWVANALVRALDEVSRRGLRSLAMPVLGARYGTMTPARFMTLLKAALSQHSPGTLERLWLILPEGSDCTVLDLLR